MVEMQASATPLPPFLTLRARPPRLDLWAAAPHLSAGARQRFQPAAKNTWNRRRRHRQRRRHRGAELPRAEFVSEPPRAPAHRGHTPGGSDASGSRRAGPAGRGASSRWFRGIRSPASGAKDRAVGEEEAGPGAAAEGKVATGPEGRASEGGRVPRRGSGPDRRLGARQPGRAGTRGRLRAPGAASDRGELRGRAGEPATALRLRDTEGPGPRADCCAPSPARAPAGLLLPSRPLPAGARRPRPGPRRRGCDRATGAAGPASPRRERGASARLLRNGGSGSPVSSRAGSISRAGELEALGPVPATEALSRPPRPSDGAGVQWRSVAKCLLHQ